MVAWFSADCPESFQLKSWLSLGPLAAAQITGALVQASRLQLYVSSAVSNFFFGEGYEGLIFRKSSSAEIDANGASVGEGPECSAR